MGVAQIGLVLSAVLLNTFAQMLLKAGTNSLQVLFLPEKGVFYSIFRAMFNPFITGGLVLYVLSFGVWVVVLSKLEVGVAYPLLSLGYLVGLILAWLFFGELLTFNKLVGVLFLMVGTYFITR
ncbi:4-amino-4-deoxy-L-arabinose transferase [Alcaligenes sp. 1735tsa3]|uniref:4-amino-4-deoxy-L-arabinose transferase n=1 Tax=Alcaligenes sp. 1735tsa3 TaxID=2953809 RepID=UPI0020A8013E|nr:4-amino-4-deoxy-L-arabinose transferase [Alcaligenes sp. 1735tsa3]USY25019.1 4-amino-4-deoxy-L-arabinose transferase [Alcaligenes sp. 1735tsa3]